MIIYSFISISNSGQSIKEHRKGDSWIGFDAGRAGPLTLCTSSPPPLILLLLLLLLLLLHARPHSDDFCHFALVPQPERSPSSRSKLCSDWKIKFLLIFYDSFRNVSEKEPQYQHIWRQFLCFSNNLVGYVFSSKKRYFRRKKKYNNHDLLESLGDG